MKKHVTGYMLMGAHEKLNGFRGTEDNQGITGYYGSVCALYKIFCTPFTHALTQTHSH